MRHPDPRPLSPLLTGTVRTAGTALGLVFAVTALVRRSKPLHPVGTVAKAALVVRPAPARSGSPLLDGPGEHDCLVRASHAIGSGPEHADIEGFALRVLPSGEDTDTTDILFASTGGGPLGRHVLTVRAPGRHAVQTTLLPVRSAGRALQLRLDPLDPGTQPWPASYRLSWAHGRGVWRPFGTLTVAWDGERDAPERFDPLVHPLPGTTAYPVVAWLREPAYRLARRARPSAGRLRTTRPTRTRPSA